VSWALTLRHSVFAIQSGLDLVGFYSGARGRAGRGASGPRAPQRAVGHEIPIKDRRWEAARTGSRLLAPFFYFSSLRTPNISPF